MGSIGSNNTEDQRIQGILGSYLISRSIDTSVERQPAGHLDQDTLSAFVEGNLTEREATPMIGHLSDCSFCRHVTAELVRLDAVFADEPVPLIQEAAEPSRISEVLNGILSRIFGARDGSAVFAHNEEDDSKDKEEKPEEETDK